jgi:AcrR family transcriptional regulator
VPRSNNPKPESDRPERLVADAEIGKAPRRRRMGSVGDRQEHQAPVKINALRSPRPTGRRPTPSPRRAAQGPGEEVTPLRPGLRQIKRERVRRQIEVVALELFDQKGFDATTVEEIAAAVDVSPRTFFRYFASKEDVLLVVMDEGQFDILTAADRLYDGTPRSLLGALLVFSEGLDRRRSDLLRAARLLGQPSLYPSRLRHSRQLDDSLSAVLARHHGRSQPTAADRALAALAASAMSISMRIWLESGADEPFRGVFISTLRVLSELGHAAGSATLIQP